MADPRSAARWRLQGLLMAVALGCTQGLLAAAPQATPAPQTPVTQASAQGAASAQPAKPAVVSPQPAAAASAQPAAAARPAPKPVPVSSTTSSAPATVSAKPATPAAVSAQPAAAPTTAGAASASAPADAAALVTHNISGRLQLSSGGRALRPEEAVDAVVYFRSSAVATPVKVPTQPYVVVTERKTFNPRVLPIPVGASVRFPNNDPILHNVFSNAKENTFDLGLYGKGDGDAETFEQPGVIQVFCNVHHSMVAYVLVMDTPHFVKPDASGRFRLSQLPAGPGELFVWHERAQLWRQTVSVDRDLELSIPLELSKRRVPPHLNKHGQPYRRARPDEY